jgi:hypothetical protein
VLEYRGDAQESLTDTIINGGRIECESQPQPMVLVRLPVGSGNNRSPDSTARALAGVGDGQPYRYGAPLTLFAWGVRGNHEGNGFGS